MHPLQFNSRFSANTQDERLLDQINQKATPTAQAIALTPKFQQLHESLTLGPEHHLVTNAMSVKTKRPPHVSHVTNAKHKKLILPNASATLDNSSAYRHFMTTKNKFNMHDKNQSQLTANYSGYTKDSLSNTAAAPSQQKWSASPHNHEEQANVLGWAHQFKSVKSPFESKPGMKMSTYGGDKRQDRLRYAFEDRD